VTHFHLIYQQCLGRRAASSMAAQNGQAANADTHFFDNLISIKSSLLRHNMRVYINKNLVDPEI
jgi:hypothetical protein